jgi:glutamate racemase
MNQAIGIIDSGVGGLSIASKLIEKLPNESFIYLADSKNCPYGEKTSEEIYNLTQKMVNFLLKKDIKLLVIACNTITVTSIQKLRQDYPKLPIVGIVPVLKTAAERTKNGKIGIFSTNITANSKYQKDLIEKFAANCQVVNVGSSSLVSLIEKQDFKEVDNVLKQELEVFANSGIDILALGCSHFSLIKDKIQAYLPDVLILDSGVAVSNQVEKILQHNNLLSDNKDPNYNFYTTGNLEQIEYFLDKLTKKAIIETISLQ